MLDWCCVLHLFIPIVPGGTGGKTQQNKKDIFMIIHSSLFVFIGNKFSLIILLLVGYSEI